MSDTLNAHVVLHKLAQALPADRRDQIIIVGSLSAAAQLIKEGETELRTKDIDGMVAPNATAVIAATEIATKLIEEGWIASTDSAKYTLPADETTPDKELPVVRLRPPGESKDEWFLELLGAPPALCPDPDGKTRYSARVKTPTSHFEIPSFAYLGVTQYAPENHASGLKLASVATMALSNLLHHPEIGDQTMSALIEGRKIKRANKDLGRVVAMSFLSDQLDEDAVEQWPATWLAAMDALNAPAPTRAKIATINSGIEALRNSHEDQDEALHSINYGLLSRHPINLRQFLIAIDRYLSLTITR